MGGFHALAYSSADVVPKSSSEGRPGPGTTSLTVVAASSGIAAALTNGVVAARSAIARVMIFDIVTDDVCRDCRLSKYERCVVRVLLKKGGGFFD